jgi:hypothetical protein
MASSINIQDIDLSDKYQKIYEKYEIKADIKVENLTKQNETYTDLRSKTNQLKSDIRAFRLKYMTAKREALTGTLESTTTEVLQFMINDIYDQAIELGKSDRKIANVARRMKFMSISENLNQLSKSKDNKGITELLSTSDTIQFAVDDLFTQADSVYKTSDRKLSNLKTKIAKETTIADKSKYKFKSDLFNLEKYQEVAEYTLASFKAYLKIDT